MRWLDDGHEFEQALGVGDEQGRLACCSSWSHKELNTTMKVKEESEKTGFKLNIQKMKTMASGPITSCK